MLDYKDIIIKHYALHMSGRKIAEVIGASKSGVNDFLKAFERCESLSYPLPSGITNYGIAELVYGKTPDGKEGRDIVGQLSRQIFMPFIMNLVNVCSSHEHTIPFIA